MKHFSFLIAALFIFLKFASGQTGPGGVGSSSTNPLWLDANRLALTNGSLISSWTDFSGNGNNAVQGSSSRRPVFQTNQLNGKPAVRFDGTSDYMQTGAIAALNTNDLTWYIVSDASMATTQILMRSRYTSGAGSSSVTYLGTYVGSGQYISHTRNSSGVLASINQGSESDYTLISARWDGSTFTAFKDGTQSGSIAVSSTPSGHVLTRIGADSYSLQYYLNGFIPEIIAFNMSLNSAQRIIVDNYLAAKYALTISNDKFAFDATHGNEVAGIGQEGTESHTDAKGSGIVRINTPSALSAGDYLLWGHDNASTTSSSSDMPSGITSRLPREWRVDKTGDAGTVTVVFDLTGITFGSSTGYYLLTDADGTFSNATVSATAGTFNALDNTVTFTGVNFSDGEYFTLGNADMIVSVQTGNWNTASTWNCTCIPVASNDVQISNTHTVTVDAAAAVGDITIVSGGTLAFSAGVNLDITEDLDNQGTFTAGTGSVTFNGTAAQTISSTGTIAFYDITLNNSSGLTLGAAANISNSLTATAGTFAAGANTVTLLSDATTTARLGVTGATGSYTGSDYIVQRFISARAANWSELGSPIQNSTINDWDQEIFMSGVGGNDGNACCPIYYSVYTYDETTDNYNAITSVATALSPGIGYELYLGTTSTTMAATTLDTRGTPSFGAVPVSITNTGSNPTSPGWNLVGNPYASALSWSSIHSEHATLDDEIQIFDATTGTYAVYGLGTDIPSTQGFWVFTSASTTLTFQESHKSTSNSSTFLRTLSPLDEFTLSIGNNVNPFTHKAKIRLNGDAARTVENMDVTFIKSPVKEAPAITFVEEGKDLVINSFAPQEKTVIPVAVHAGIEGIYTIQASGIAGVSNEYSCVVLEDKLTNQLIDLQAQPSYSFQTQAGEIKERFVLHMSKDANACGRISSPAMASSNDIQVIKNSEGIFVKFNTAETGTAIISVVNVLGQQIMGNLQVEAGEQLVKLDLPNDLNGVYFVKVQLADRDMVEKIFIREQN